MGRLRDWWEHLAPRERRLMSLLGITAVVCVFAFIGIMINNGLSELEKKNAAMRTALRTIDERRDVIVGASSQDSAVLAMIGDTAPPLATYLEGIEGEVGVQIRNSTERPALPKGKFKEHALQVTLYNVTLAELTEFLRKIETKSPAVVTQRIYVKRSSSSPDKMDRVEITVATWERGGGKSESKKGEAKDKESKDAGQGKPAEGGAP
jgi:hypothetical protein